MEIASAEVIPYALPFRDPYVTARGTLLRREIVLLRLRDSDGVIGLGEAVPMSLRGDDTAAGVAKRLREAAQTLIATSLPDRGAKKSTSERHIRPTGSGAVGCALEMALLDLRARREGVPACRLLGGDEPGAVQCNATLAAGPPAEVAGAARVWAEEGFRFFKLKLGAEPGDAEQVDAVRAELGPGASIRVDVNGAWSVDEAATELDRIAPHVIELAEQPVATLEEMASLQAQTSIPLSADESINSPEDAEQARRLNACSLATVKLSKVGGFEAAARIAGAIPTYLSSALDGPVGIAAAAHLAAALRDRALLAATAHGLATQRLFASTIAGVESRLEGDLLQAPEGPGFGVEIDDAALERHRL
jgi:L-Ala-D/L-Glu epimerase / N-acetyl-D-glutamate racemase